MMDKIDKAVKHVSKAFEGKISRGPDYHIGGHPYSTIDVLYKPEDKYYYRYVIQSPFIANKILRQSKTRGIGKALSTAKQAAEKTFRIDRDTEEKQEL